MLQSVGLWCVPQSVGCVGLGELPLSSFWFLIQLGICMLGINMLLFMCNALMKLICKIDSCTLKVQYSYILLLLGLFYYGSFVLNEAKSRKIFGTGAQVRGFFAGNN